MDDKTLNTEEVVEETTAEVTEPTSKEVKNEEKPQPKGFKKVWIMLKNYLKGIGYDMKRAIKDNPSIIWMLFLCVPGIFIGFFITNHMNAANVLTGTYGYTGLLCFIMELAGCLNIVWAFNVMKKRNLKSSIFAAITTAIIVTCGIVWVYTLYKNGEHVFADDNQFKSDSYISIVCMIVASVCPFIGAVGSFFTRNKNYKKDTL